MYNKINIRVMSRLDAFKYCLKDHKETTAIISISTPYIVYEYGVFKDESNKVIDILELCFVDADEPYTQDIYDVYASEMDLLCDSDAKRIAEFAERYVGKNISLIVHCDAGISRSSAVAAAILRHYTGDDAQIFDDYNSYDPNMLVYFKVLKAFGDHIVNCSMICKEEIGHVYDRKRQCFLCFRHTRIQL